MVASLAANNIEDSPFCVCHCNMNMHWAGLPKPITTPDSLIISLIAKRQANKGQSGAVLPIQAIARYTGLCD